MPATHYYIFICVTVLVSIDLYYSCQQPRVSTSVFSFFFYKLIISSGTTFDDRYSPFAIKRKKRCLKKEGGWPEKQVIFFVWPKIKEFSTCKYCREHMRRCMHTCSIADSISSNHISLFVTCYM